MSLRPNLAVVWFDRVDDTVRSAVLEGTESARPQLDSRLNALYARHWGELCNYVKKQFGAGPPYPEDVAQEAFIKFASLEKCHEIDNPRAYLYRTAHNVLIDEQRRLALRGAAGSEAKAFALSDDRTPERVLVGREQLDVLTRALLAMPDVRRRSFLLNRLHGLSCVAIARMTGYSESAVKKHLRLAMIDLEAALTAAERAGPLT